MDGPFDLSGTEDNLATGAFDVSSIMNPPQNSAQKAKSGSDDLSSAYKAVAALKAVEPKSYEQIQKEQRENPYIETGFGRHLKTPEQRAMDDIMNRGYQNVRGFESGVQNPTYFQGLSNAVSEYQSTLKGILGGTPEGVSYGPVAGSSLSSVGGLSKYEGDTSQTFGKNIAAYGQKPYTSEDVIKKAGIDRAAKASQETQTAAKKKKEEEDQLKKAQEDPAEEVD